jgi:hypothetical protein
MSRPNLTDEQIKLIMDQENHSHGQENGDQPLQGEASDKVPNLGF